MSVDTSAFSFDPPALKPDGAADFIMRLPAGLSGKQLLFDAFRVGLRFPAYFGNNWDAFADCLNDLSWMPQRRIAIVHADLPNLPLQDTLTYIEILSQCARGWQRTQEHEFIVLFPPELRAIIMDLPQRTKVRA